LKYAGKDATYDILHTPFLRFLCHSGSAAYDPIHPPDAITTNLKPEKQSVFSIKIIIGYNSLAFSLGSVDLATVEKVEVKITDEERARQGRIAARPPLSEILNLHDFEVWLRHVEKVYTYGILQAIAKYTMPEKAWAYYSSAADDEITNRENHAAFHRYI
jgi:L-lactate dehydrogenase (cytochrome)